MKKLLMSLDDFLYNINQKAYDWLHNEFDIYVGTYRIVFLFITTGIFMVVDFEWWMQTGSNFNLYLGIFVFLTLFPAYKDHFFKENVLQAKGRYAELNLLANICHTFNKHFYIRCGANILAFINIFVLTLGDNKQINYFVTTAFIVNMIYGYALMVLVRPRNPRKRTANNRNLVSDLGV